MSKLMWIVGILLAAAGAALVLMVFVSGASVAQMGIRLEGAAILLVGGFLSLGLGSVINLLDEQRKLLAERSILASAAAPGAPIPEFGRKAGETAGTAGVAAAAGAAAAAVAAPAREEEVSEPTRDTIQQLEQARQKIEQAFEPKPEEAETATDRATTLEMVKAMSPDQRRAFTVAFRDAFNVPREARAVAPLITEECHRQFVCRFVDEAEGIAAP